MLCFTQHALLRDTSATASGPPASVHFLLPSSCNVIVVPAAVQHVTWILGVAEADMSEETCLHVFTRVNETEAHVVSQARASPTVSISMTGTAAVRLCSNTGIQIVEVVRASVREAWPIADCQQHARFVLFLPPHGNATMLMRDHLMKETPELILEEDTLSSVHLRDSL